ncbi:sulfatase/phosphatase domain-containing protein [Paenibacillus donghaensis]|uniref:sulfatase/phosphatase domain-containing protein n=1 Tax=Paenibacillus donghaensis TaxID=414771 RepID=UPI001B804289|nr:sulfatase/phosphatase domain-containing protein [Paenibacillus donghaensis]
MNKEPPRDQPLCIYLPILYPHPPYAVEDPWHSAVDRSLLPKRIHAAEHRDAVFCEGGRLHGELHCNESTPYNEDPHSLYWPRGEMQRSEGAEHTKATMIRTKRFKYVCRFYEKDELYDLLNDPGETVNVIDDNSQAAELAFLKERMLDFYQETCDTVPWGRAKREI